MRQPPQPDRRSGGAAILEEEKQAKTFHSHGGQLLMVSEESMYGLWQRLRAKHPSSSSSSSSRPEDSWGSWEVARTDLIRRLRPNVVVKLVGEGEGELGLS